MTKRILAVDDDTDIHLLLKAYLKNDYELDFAKSGKEALEKLNAGAPYPDLILLDMNMDGMNGIQFKKLLNSDPKLAHIDVMYLSADLEAMDRISFDQETAHLNHKEEKELLPYVLSKPIRKEDLLTLLEMFFNFQKK